MPPVAIICGLLLVVVGGIGYSLSDAANPVTALIPAFVGGILVLLGVIGLAGESARKHAMHVAAMVGLLGLLAAGARLAMTLAKGGGSTLGISSLAAMALICGIFLVLCINSFRQARKNRVATETKGR